MSLIKRSELVHHLAEAYSLISMAHQELFMLMRSEQHPRGAEVFLDRITGDLAAADLILHNVRAWVQEQPRSAMDHTLPLSTATKTPSGDGGKTMNTPLFAPSHINDPVMEARPLQKEDFDAIKKWEP